MRFNCVFKYMKERRITKDTFRENLKNLHIKQMPDSWLLVLAR